MNRLALLFRNLLIFVAVLPSWALAGAWPLKPGSGKATAALSVLPAQSVIDAQGDKRKYAITESEAVTYGEIGLVPRLSLGWVWGFLKAVRSDSGDQVATTDPELALSWYMGKRGSLVFALQTLGQFPLGPENPDRVPDFAPVFFSQRAFAFELRPLIGWSGGGWWAQAGMGARVRTADLAGQFRYSAAAGRGFGARFSGLLALDGVVPLDHESSGKPGDRIQYYGYHLAGDFLILRDWRIGAQFDSMLTLGQELPLGARFSLFTRIGWD